MPLHEPEIAMVDLIPEREPHDDLQTTIEKAITHILDDRSPSEEEKAKEKRKKTAVGAGKFLGIIASVAMSAYFGLQQAISERPTKQETKDEISEVKAAHKDADDRVDEVEREVIKLEGKIDALDRKVSEGFADIKEELRYLRRK